MAGIDFLKGNKIKEEEEESPVNNIEELCKESDIHNYKHNIMKPDDYAFCLNSFRVFEGRETKSYNKKDLLNNVENNHIRPENCMYLEEKHFR